MLVKIMNINALFDSSSHPQPFDHVFLRVKTSNEVVLVKNRVKRFESGQGATAVKFRTWDYDIETVKGETKTFCHEDFLPDVSREEQLKFGREHSPNRI
jgi:hypothetical protein